MLTSTNAENRYAASAYHGGSCALRADFLAPTIPLARTVLALDTGYILHAGHGVPDVRGGVLAGTVTPAIAHAISGS